MKTVGFLLFLLQLKCADVLEAKYRKEKKWCFIFVSGSVRNETQGLLQGNSSA